MKSGGEKLVLIGSVVKNKDDLDQPGLRRRLGLCGQADGAAVGRRLKNAIGSIGCFVLLVGFIVMIARGSAACRLNLVEDVMHPMGRGIE